MVLVLLCSTLCCFKFYNPFSEAEKAGCFTFIAFRCHVTISIFVYLSQWVDLQCVILAYPGHSHFLFGC